ncbi:hypothetical protein TRFO_26724 [Tritrichomonas foetus]|uniref:Uncharacterized protein n=1 Tax=Tritrichomonas foetus TaxID=1144522 RepID=A0A1J4K298_9EUKA|nr:hypothetical protein TRFO_26724 [Tritrichomonas foetus]|eukprot:OHT05519.1 hypothetical protein TRFO_26724 [Tritrichomonas foetus]
MRNHQESDSDKSLSFESEFTKHVLSLFCCLYDCHAAPYIGHIPHDNIHPTGEEEEEAYEAPPAFHDKLCDFRLDNSYKAYLNAREPMIQELSARKETLIENVNKYNERRNGTDNKAGISESFIDSDEIILGERLQARTASGKTSEGELHKRRQEFIEKSRKSAEIRRKRLIEKRKNTKFENAKQEREVSKELKKYNDKVKNTEIRNRKKVAAERREIMIQKRKKQLRARAEEFDKEEEAKKSLGKISYHSQNMDRSDFHSRERDAQDEKYRSMRVKKETAEQINEYNHNTIKPKPSGRKVIFRK